MTRTASALLVGALVGDLSAVVGAALLEAESAERLPRGTLDLVPAASSGDGGTVRPARLDRLAVWAGAKGTSTEQLIAVLGALVRGRVGHGGVRRTALVVRRAAIRWQERPLARGYENVQLAVATAPSPDDDLAARPLGVAVGSRRSGRRELLGLWAAMPQHDPYLWRSVLIDLRRRGVDDVECVVGEASPALAHALPRTWPRAVLAA